jgi:hypothetical protein
MQYLQVFTDYGAKDRLQRYQGTRALINGTLIGQVIKETRSKFD